MFFYTVIKQCLLISSKWDKTTVYFKPVVSISITLETCDFFPGGLWHSSLIESNVIDFFLPFLPLERRHVKLCIRDNLEEKGYHVTEEILNKVANELLYYPAESKLFSKSGCKRVSQKVDVVIMEEEEDWLRKFGVISCLQSDECFKIIVKHFDGFCNSAKLTIM